MSILKITKKARRSWVDAVAALCVLVLLVAGLPARAVAAQAAPPHWRSAVDALRISETDDQITLSVRNDDIARLDPGLVLAVLDRAMSGGAPVLTDAIKTSFDAHPLDMGLSSADREPWADSEGTVSISDDNIVSISFPADEERTEASWWVKLLAAGAGFVIRVLMQLACYAVFNVGAPLAAPVCNTLGDFTGVMVYQAIVIFVDGKQGDPKQWGEGLAMAVLASVGTALWESGLNTFARTQMRPLFEKARDYIRDMAAKASAWVKGKIGAALLKMADAYDWLSTHIADMFEAAHRALTSSTGTGALKIMVVGDSMSQGYEGDYTWRYRLWQWFQEQHVAVDFVGPYSGTMPPEQAAPPSPPLLQGESAPVGRPRTTGAYAAQMAPFDSQHFAVWGRQAAQAKELIREQVAVWQPDLLLVGLGFNDLGWFVSGPEGTLASMKALVDNARAARPNLKFALANVPQRTRIDGRADLPVNTDIYNRMLADAVPRWSTAASPVRLVDWRGNYSCEVAGCPGGYDGLHPNGFGESQIARAFAQTLHGGYGIGATVPPVPTDAPVRPLSTPAQVRAVASPGGFTVVWDPVFGASGYTVRHRLVGQSTWSELPAKAARFDNGWVLDGQQWEAQVRADYGNQASNWSNVVSTTVHPQTAAGPTNILNLPASDGFDIAWEPPTGAFTSSIDRYVVLVHDRDTPGAFLNAIGIRGTYAHIGGLIPGHRYTIAVQTWNAAGGGFPAVAKSITVGAGIPGDLSGLAITPTDPTTVRLSWNPAAGAAGYEIRIRNITAPDPKPEPSYEETTGTTHTIAFLYPGHQNFEYCVRPYNGIARGGWSCVVSGKPPVS